MGKRRKKFIKPPYQSKRYDVVDVQFTEIPRKPEQIEYTAEQTATNKPEQNVNKPEQTANNPEQTTKPEESAEHRSPKEVMDSIVTTLFSKVDAQLYEQLLQLEKLLKNPRNNINRNG